MAEFASEAGGEEPYKYVFIAGTACINLVFSGIRGERNEFKLGAPMHHIHGRVPGMKEHNWHPRLAHIFSGVTAEHPFYRTNWSVVEHNLNTHYLHDDLRFTSEAEVATAYGSMSKADRDEQAREEFSELTSRATETETALSDAWAANFEYVAQPWSLLCH